jgi:hypothetical protein
VACLLWGQLVAVHTQLPPRRDHHRDRRRRWCVGQPVHATRAREELTLHQCECSRSSLSAGRRCGGRWLFATCRQLACHVISRGCARLSCVVDAWMCGSVDVFVSRDREPVVVGHADSCRCAEGDGRPHQRRGVYCHVGERVRPSLRHFARPLRPSVRLAHSVMSFAMCSASPGLKPASAGGL